jgi:hypothetical protein
MIIEYTHPELDIEVRAPSGSYIPREENILSYAGREVMYIVGLMVIETSCCGIGSWEYVQVPGYLVRMGETPNKNKEPKSKIDTIQNEKDRTAVYKLLEQKYPGARIEIW